MRTYSDRSTVADPGLVVHDDLAVRFVRSVAQLIKASHNEDLIR
jgi:hypothetical protein